MSVVVRNEHDARYGSAMPRIPQAVANTLLERRRGMLEEIAAGGAKARGVSNAGGIAPAGEWQPELHLGQVPKHLPGIFGAVPAHRDVVDVAQLETLATKAPGKSMTGEEATGHFHPGEPLFLAEGPHDTPAHQTGRRVFSEGADAQDVHGARSPVLTAGMRSWGGCAPGRTDRQ